MRVVSVPLRALVYLISLLPFPLIYLISDILYIFLYKIFGYRTAVVRDNLRKSFPDKNPAALLEIEKAFYHNLCDVMAEFMKMPSITRTQLQKRMVLTNPEYLQQVLGEHKGIIAIGTHLCNWEWGGISLSATVPGFHYLGVYKPLTSKWSDTWFRQLRSRFGMTMVPMKSTYRALLGTYEKPILLTLIADQTPTLSETEYEADFLGRKTPVFLGSEKIARSTGMPVVYFSIKRVRRGFYTFTALPVTVNPKAEPEYGITKKHLALLEKDILENPGDWLWSHRRWKHSGKLSPQPDHANKV
jgi:KDO2-lipid IV(A) lauroyltransferase